MTGDDPDVTGWSAATAAGLDQALVEGAVAVLAADCGELLVEDGDQFAVLARAGDCPADAPEAYPRWTGLLGQAHEAGRPFVVDDLADVRSAAASADTSTDIGYRSLYCVPVGEHGLLVARSRSPGAFADAERSVAGDLAELAAAALGRGAAPPTAVMDGGRRADRDPEELLEELADILSHDLASPLTVVEGNLTLARETGEERYFDRAAAALGRIEDLVEEVVVLARTGRLVEQTSHVDLRERARTAWDNVDTADATLEVPGSVTFVASERGVAHLLENLVENVVVHAGPDATVRVGPTEDGFYVEDDGPGIPAEDLPRIFDRGYTSGAGSTGLGLHIVDRIAAAHGWDLRVEDGDLGGARFVVSGVDVIADER